MSSPEPTPRELCDWAQELAWQAGRITLGYFRTGVQPEWKSDASPVTIADRQAEEHMRQMIKDRFPAHGILGEEYGMVNEGSPWRWILDPIDGTKSFVQGVPLYGVLVGLEHQGVPVVGVCYLPALDEMVAAAQGEGCTDNGRRAHVSALEELKQAAFLCNNPQTMQAQGRGAAYDRLCAATRLQRGWGDCYGHILVATGRAEVMVDPVMNAWDCAALLPILQEAGGSFTDWQGMPTIHGGNAISTNGKLLPAVLELI
ncbi:MAG: histidinol-phosphatase [Herpetosiphonaceae bacterium]|nr:histidinol-phosphatase [Herpetosiphonaceae bacterium]